MSQSRDYNLGYLDGQIEALDRASCIADYHWRKLEAGKILRQLLVQAQTEKAKLTAGHPVKNHDENT